jgi:pimeloyl-ACP methyl ester carboxylesterase
MLAAGCLLTSAAALPVSNAAGASASSCLAALPQVQQVTTHGHTQLAGSTPVLFVHGINSGPGVWGPGSPASISGQVAAIKGVTAWTFSYAHQSLLWVTNRAIGPSLAQAILCLATASRHKVVLIGHSMGGLAAQFALGQDGGQVAADSAELITIGTPFDGSHIATVGEDVINYGGLAELGDPVALPIEAELSACAGVADHTDTNPCWLVSVLRSPVGTALEQNSAAIAKLPAWPAGFPVLDIAGDMKVFVGVAGHGKTIDFGDGAVTLSSATSHATDGSPLVVRCAKTVYHLLSIDAGLCFHTSLPHNPAVEAAVVADIRALAEPTAVIDLAPVSSAGLPRPGEAITDGGTGQCGAGSDSVGQAYRCFGSGGNGIYDPCWLDNADPAQASVLCQEEPWSTKVIRLTIPAGGLESFLGPFEPIDPSFPWGVQLSDGERCIALQGAHGTFDGKVIDYACGPHYDHVLLRPLNRTLPSWTYQSAYVSGSGYAAGPTEHVAIAWYANPDNGAAVDDQHNDCTATALADAAQDYEAAHNNPNGPLPEINAQACDAGYAEVVFTQSAPPPGYTATLAFKATATGWQEIGSADFIIPGQFGMPVSVGKTINKELEAAPQTEQVGF